MGALNRGGHFHAGSGTTQNILGACQYRPWIADCRTAESTVLGDLLADSEALGIIRYGSCGGTGTAAVHPVPEGSEISV